MFLPSFLKTIDVLQGVIWTIFFNSQNYHLLDTLMNMRCPFDIFSLQLMMMHYTLWKYFVDLTLSYPPNPYSMTLKKHAGFALIKKDAAYRLRSCITSVQTQSRVYWEPMQYSSPCTSAQGTLEYQEKTNLTGIKFPHGHPWEGIAPNSKCQGNVQLHIMGCAAEYPFALWEHTLQNNTILSKSLLAARIAGCCQGELLNRERAVCWNIAHQ